MTPISLCVMYNILYHHDSLGALLGGEAACGHDPLHQLAAVPGLGGEVRRQVEAGAVQQLGADLRHHAAGAN